MVWLALLTAVFCGTSPVLREARLGMMLVSKHE